VNARLPLVIKGSVQTAGVQIYFHRDLSIAQFGTSALRTLRIAGDWPAHPGKRHPQGEVWEEEVEDFVVQHLCRPLVAA